MHSSMPYRGRYQRLQLYGDHQYANRRLHLFQYQLVNVLPADPTCDQRILYRY